MSKQDFGRRPIGYVQRRLLSSKRPAPDWMEKLLAEPERPEEPEYRPNLWSEFREALEKRR